MENLTYKETNKKSTREKAKLIKRIQWHSYERVLGPSIPALRSYMIFICNMLYNTFHLQNEKKKKKLGSLIDQTMNNWTQFVQIGDTMDLANIWPSNLRPITTTDLHVWIQILICWGPVWRPRGRWAPRLGMHICVSAGIHMHHMHKWLHIRLVVLILLRSCNNGGSISIVPDF